jgi:shikimate kinase
MMKLPNIYLIGPLGAGKSSVGRRLAKMTHQHFIDTDEEIEHRSGVDLNWIFEVEGEPGYRKRETTVIKELCQKSNTLLSTGGGSVLVPQNCKTLSATGTVIYLEVSFEQQFERTRRRRGTRPVLEAGEDSFRENLRNLNNEREKLYKQIADITYRTDDYDAQHLARLIFEDIKAQQAQAF